ncbi:MAG: choice-of-anchor D domain-containing protein, partial [Actinomycetota bacterium]
IAADISFTPEGIDFGDVEVGETSPPATITLTNSGDATLVITALSISGPDASDFNIASDGCSGALVSPGQSCQVQVELTPSGLGEHAATLNVTSNVPGPPRTAGLAGVGIDTTPPQSSWTTGNNAIVISLLQSVGGTTSDLVGVDSASVTFTDLLGSAMTVPATLTCSNQRRSCSFSATVPLMLPGPATATINATDTSGNTSSGPTIMLLVV